MTAGTEAGVKNGPTELRIAEPLALASQHDPVVAAAGDIACDPAKSSFNDGEGTSSSCKQKAVSDLLVNQGLAAVMPLGDNQYYCGSLQAYQESYDLSWGRVKDITFPAVGNHEYITSDGPERTGCNSSNEGAAGHYGYFGSAAGDPDKGYYSYDVGTWHVIVLNSNCSKAGGCSENTPQGQWLRQDLAAHPNTCTLAYWHQPLFSSGGRDNDRYKTFWDALYEADADLVLASHDHTYERFAKQTPDGVADPVRGIRSFIVGTGGANHTSFVDIRPNSEVRDDRTYGVLKLTLRPSSYDWEFVPIAGQTFTDTGTDQCHGSSSDTTPPNDPTDLTATVDGPRQVTLSWTDNGDDVGVIGFRIYRNGTEIGTSPSTSFVDDTAEPDTTYDYHVTAYDAGNNESGPSNTETVTTEAETPPPPGATTVTLTPTADTFVRSDRATTSFGSNTSLDVDGSPQKETLIKFTVDENKLVIDATLRLHVVDKSNQGGFFYPTTNAWSESTTWNDRPSANGSLLGSLGSVSAGSWYELDVSTYVDKDGVFSFIADSPSSNGADFSSSEGAAALQPQLVLTVDSGAPPPPGDTDPPTVPGNLRETSVSATEATIAWDASTDTGTGVREYVVYRDNAEIDRTTGTSYTDTNLVADTTYAYEVSAVDGASNESGRAGPLDVTTDTAPPPPPGDTDPPTVPGKLRETSVSATEATIAWDASTDTGTGVSEYVVYRDNTEIARPTGTSYTDTGLTSETTYTYEVSAVDGATNESGRAGPLDVTTDTAPPGPPGGTTVTLLPTLDTFVRDDAPDRSFGSAAKLYTDGSPQKETYLRFTVAEGKQVLSAKIRLHCVDKSDEGGVFYETNDPWSNSTTWNDKPNPTGSSLGSLGPVQVDTWYELDVSSVVTGDGTYNFLVDSELSNGADFVSSEGTAGLEPQLVLEVG